MKKKYFPLCFVLAVVSGLAAIGCNNSTPVNLNPDLTDSTVVGTPKFSILGPPQLSDTRARIVNTGGTSPFLYVGEADGKRASFLIRFIFTNFPQPDSLTVNAAELVLRQGKPIGGGNGSFTATAHRATANWIENQVTSETFAGAFDAAILGSTTITAADSDTVVIPIDASLVQVWADTSDSSFANFGIYVQAQGATFLKQVNSRNAETALPRLRIYGNRASGAADTLEAVALDDAFLFEVLQPPTEGPLYVGNGFEHRSYLRYDLTSIPSAATINFAQLRLPIDTTRTFIAGNEGVVFSLFAVLNESQNLENLMEPLETMVADGRIRGVTGSVLVAVDSTRSLQVSLRTLVQEWRQGFVSNNGILVVASRPNRDLFRVAFANQASDSSRAPRLEIYYTVPPTTN